MLRKISCKALVHITQLFNHILMSGYLSTAWKSTKVISIPKPGKSPPEPGSHRPISLVSTILIYVQQDATLQVNFIWKPLYMFRVVPPPIIRSANNCVYSIWYLSHRYCYLPLLAAVAVTVWQIPDAVDTVVCAPDDGWWYHPKHVEQFSDKVNCVALHLVWHILEYVIRIQNLKAAKVNPSTLNTEHCRV